MAVLVFCHTILHLDFDLWLKQAITLLVIVVPVPISTPVAIYAA
jgi:Cd2+/Zn2+-exporting ATPase